MSIKTKQSPDKRKPDRPQLQKVPNRFLGNMQKRLRLALIAVLVLLSILLVRIAVLQQTRGEAYEKRILNRQNTTTSVTPFRRGTITDRNGVLLAYSRDVYYLILDPSVMLADSAQKNRNITVTTLAEQFGLDREKLEKTLDENPDSMYIRFASGISREQRDAFLAVQAEYNNGTSKKLHKDKITGVWFEMDYERCYPEETLACSVLGFSGSEYDRGTWGLEQYYNSELTGVNGRSYTYMNGDGEYETVTQSPQNGNTVISTIDYTIQSVVEEKIAAFCAENIYTNVGVVVMDPDNGEILAMATDKVYNPGSPTDMSYSYSEETLAGLTDEEKTDLRNAMWRNFTISDAYTPGSVGKELTVSTALEEGVTNADEHFICDGGETFQSTHIGCTSTHGSLSLTEALMYSCNDVMMQLSVRLSNATFLRYQKNFGLGTATGIDLPGESAGVIFREDKMMTIDKATSSFGQAYSVNMVQMAAAYASIVNGGSYYQPHIVREIRDTEGNLLSGFSCTPVRQTVTEETSRFIREAAFQTVESGTGHSAKVADYQIGGKTGTAQKYPIEDQKYVISFLAFAPTDDPEVIVYVVIDEPESEGRSVSSRGAVTLSAEINAEILPYLGIQKRN